MNASYEWLRELVPAPLSADEMAAILTAKAASVDEVAPLRSDLASVVVARVVHAERHPDSDHLWVTKVDAGGADVLDVVCGAHNVRAGALYPFAAVGTELPGGLRLEKRKIRGATSNGMLCSARELQLGEDHSGIMELDVDVPPGTPLLQAIQLGDSRIVVDVTPNRPDLLSHVGLAREIAAASGVTMNPPASLSSSASLTAHSPRVLNEHAGGTAGIAVQIDRDSACTRYAGAVIRGVRVGTSPDWLRARLEAVGARPVNNIVDVTNYILHETGQPLHAFDIATFKGNSVVVRLARVGEELQTLDATQRKLAPFMTVIADSERAHAVAGVMGGEDSAVTEATTDVFLEIATFDAGAVRATRRALSLSTDASYRFERGVDPELPGTVMQRAVDMIIAVGGGTLADAPVDLYPVPVPSLAIDLDLSRLERALGVPFNITEVAALLTAVGFTVQPAFNAPQGACARVTVPSFRQDVRAQVDLFEEVARLRGYDSFPNEIRPYRPGNAPGDSMHKLANRLRATLVAEGFHEARPLPFVSGSDVSHVRIANPISEDERHLRNSLLESLSRRVEYNLSHMQRTVRLFEVGNVFAPVDGTSLPLEEVRVAAVLLGDRHPAHFSLPRPPHCDEWDAKALAKRMATALSGGQQIELIVADGAVGADATLLWSISIGGVPAGRVHKLRLDTPVWAAPAFGVELSLGRTSAASVAPQGESLRLVGNVASEAAGKLPSAAAAARATVRFKALPAFPAADFDVALIVPDAIAAATVERTVRAAAGDLLESVTIFDEFRGPGVPLGTRSLALRLTLRHAERTLRDKEIEGRKQKLLTVLEKELGVRQRST